MGKFIGLRGLYQCTMARGGVICSNKARFHILTRITPENDGHCYLACEECFPYSGDFQEMHPVTANCDMPGVFWKSNGCIVK